MLSTALAIQNATKEAVYDETVMDMARVLLLDKDSMTENEFIRNLFQYSAALSALTATLVTSVCLTESQMDEMMNTINEMEALGKDINNGN